MKGFIQPARLQLVDENMSNLTSASGEASGSSNQHSSLASPNPNPPLPRKKRNLPGNPDPEAEVVALSPKTLMATNRFLCEICNKGFQRDQNLQLHRRGHNLPWKLKQRSSKEVRKKAYLCPEPSCVHHDPSRALGDLTGIKKHFSRKHGEKKWKCDKCSKKYAVQSDWKAHSKICGTREYRCDCGTLFSRRDSFITHRAFCDALAEESMRTMATNPLVNHHQPLFPPPPPPPPAPLLNGSFPPQFQVQFPHLIRTAATEAASHLLPGQGLQDMATLKRETDQPPYNLRPEIPPWLVFHGTSSPSLNHIDLTSSIYSSKMEQEYSPENDIPHRIMQTPAAVPQPHMSATALLQKAALMGTKMSRPTASINSQLSGHGSSTSGADAAFGHQEAISLHGSIIQSPLSMMMRSMPQASAFGHGSFEDGRSGGGSGGPGNEGLTRDFLGLRAFSHRELFTMAGLETCMGTSPYEQHSKKPWPGS